MEKKRIPVSWLNKYAYCPRQLYLKKIKDVSPKSTKKMKKGKEKHRKLEKEHQKKATEELKLEEAFSRSLEEEKGFVFREIFLKNKYLKGKIDELQILPKMILVIDDKPGGKDYFSNKLQVWGYCLLFKTNFKLKKPIFSAIRERENFKINWKKEYNEKHRKKVIKAIKSIQLILDGNEPQKVTNRNKCASCRFQRHC